VPLLVAVGVRRAVVAEDQVVLRIILKNLNNLIK